MRSNEKLIAKTIEEIKKIEEPKKINDLYSYLEQLNKKEIAHIAVEGGILGPNPLIGTSSRGLGATAMMMLKTAVRNPGKVISHNASFLKEIKKIVFSQSDLKPQKGDRRFTDITWNENFLYRRALQIYLAANNELNAWVGDNEFSNNDKKRIRFLLSLLTDSLSPSNTILNPTAIKRFIETGGKSAIQGGKHLIGDIRSNGAMPSQVDKQAFKVGKNLAATPGSVIFRNDMLELIQYTPVTPKVNRRPIFFVPPQINKFYAFDLSEHNSLVQYCLKMGLQVFMVSWRNPTPNERHWSLENYINALDNAIDAVLDITSSESCNVMGACSGGVTAATLLGYYAARDIRKVNSITLQVSILDMTDDTRKLPLGLFATEKNIDNAKRYSSKKGVWEGQKMARVFSWLRPNDLIWNYWVNNYLLGNTPPAFDILYWNSDTTNLPAELHGELLDLFTTNALSKPGKLNINDTPIDLSKITCDSYLTAGLTDHICPWKACYHSSKLFGGKTEFVLSSSGHIQSILNPPGNPKSSFRVNSKYPKAPEVWMKGAKAHQGSWWEHWKKWILERSDDTIKAPENLGSKTYLPLHDAPGEYVYE